MIADARVLVVDDDDIILSIISNILIRNGYQVDKCHSGEEALEKIDQDEFDLVLLDVHMGSGLDGYDTCQLIQQKQADLPVILVTANQDDESVNKGFETGSSDYIKKPVSRLELLARVKNTITLKRSEKRNLQLIETLRRDLTIASSIQKAMLPKWISVDGDLVFSSYYQASDAVGGDLFDRLKLDDKKYVVYVGDVSGHGVQAALLMAAIKSSIKHLIEAYKDDRSLAELFTKLNERLFSDLFLQSNYLTLMMGVVDMEAQEFRFLNAGHPPLIRMNKVENTFHVHDEKGSLPLGWMQRTKYDDDDIIHIPLDPNDIYLMFTDGIYECSNGTDDQLGLDGLRNMVSQELDLDSCVTIPHKIKQFLTTHQYDTDADDFTLFSFQIHNHNSIDYLVEDAVDYITRHYTFILLSALKGVGKVSQDCENLVLNWTGDSVLSARVELIVDEFLNNIIQYGYHFQEDAEIVIEFRLTKTKLAIRFWDKGIEWIPENQDYSIDNPYDFEDGLDVSGRGIRIIQSISNSFARRRYGGINETRVEIDL